MPFRKQRDYWLRPDGTKWGGEICPRSKIPLGSQSNLRRLSMRPQPFSSKLCLVLAVKQRRRNHPGDFPFFVVAALDTNYAAKSKLHDWFAAMRLSLVTIVFRTESELLASVVGRVFSTSQNRQSRAGCALGMSYSDSGWFFQRMETSRFHHRHKRPSMPRAKPWNML